MVVPLSSLVLIGALLLVIVAPVSKVAAFIGIILDKGIWWMNSIIENLSQCPFALWEGIRISTFQVVLLYVIITGIATWLLLQKRYALWVGMISLCMIMTARVLSFNHAEKQKQLIIYNIPGGRAVDFIEGREHYLLSDSLTVTDPVIQKNIFQPAAVLYRLRQVRRIPSADKNNRLFIFQRQPVLLVDGPVETIDARGKIALAILSGNSRLYVADLIQRVQPTQIVIDGSVPAWKARYWQKDCDSLLIPCHNVALKGAFVMNL